MSRFYGMNVKIENYNEENEQAVVDAATEEWGFTDWHSWEDRLESYGENHLSGGETEEEFTDRLTAAIWQANGRFCPVTITATYLEDLPGEIHERNENHYRLWQRGKSMSEIILCDETAEPEI
jgi:hypothetical protein